MGNSQDVSTKCGKVSEQFSTDNSGKLQTYEAVPGTKIQDLKSTATSSFGAQVCLENFKLIRQECCLRRCDSNDGAIFPEEHKYKKQQNSITEKSNWEASECYRSSDLEIHQFIKLEDKWNSSRASENYSFPVKDGIEPLKRKVKIIYLKPELKQLFGITSGCNYQPNFQTTDQSIIDYLIWSNNEEEVEIVSHVDGSSLNAYLTAFYNADEHFWNEICDVISTEIDETIGQDIIIKIWEGENCSAST